LPPAPLQACNSRWWIRPDAAKRQWFRYAREIKSTALMHTTVDIQAQFTVSLSKQTMPVCVL
jgi:hypothetical protein